MTAEDFISFVKTNKKEIHRIFTEEKKPLWTFREAFKEQLSTSNDFRIGALIAYSLWGAKDFTIITWEKKLETGYLAYEGTPLVSVENINEEWFRDKISMEWAYPAFRKLLSELEMNKKITKR